MEVKLNNGMVAVIDDADAHLTCGIRWHAQVNRSGVVYAIAYGFGRKKVYMHRRILGLTDSSVHTDHIDGNGLNNVRANLRACSHAENMRNRRMRARPPSGYRGVCFRPERPNAPWVGIVYCDNRKYIKGFASAQEAGAWAKSKRAELFGPNCNVD